MAKELLSDGRLRAMKPGDRPLYDGDGLRFVASKSSPVISAQVKFPRPGDGKPDTLTLGKYRLASGRPGPLRLESARAKRDAAMRLLADGENPKVAKRVHKATKAADAAATFEKVAQSWVVSAARREKWTEEHRLQVERSVANHLSDLNALPITTIIARLTAPVLRRVDRKAPAMAEKVAQRLHAIMDHAVESGLIERNPLPKRTRSKRERKHYPAVTDLQGVGAILRAARASDPCKGITRAHVLTAYSALRVSEVVGARWEEFALDGVDVPGAPGRYRHDAGCGNWSVPRERMKRKDPARGPHVVPLPPVLLRVLRQWRHEDDGASAYVCAAPRNREKPITPEALEKHYRDALELGGKHSPHSWRSAFSTICREAGKPGDLIEAQLDHQVGNNVASAYDRAQRVELRRDLMAWYEATLIAARDGAQVLNIGKGASWPT